MLPIQTQPNQRFVVLNELLQNVHFVFAALSSRGQISCITLL